MWPKKLVILGNQKNELSTNWMDRLVLPYVSINSDLYEAATFLAWYLGLAMIKHGEVATVTPCKDFTPLVI